MVVITNTSDQVIDKGQPEQAGSSTLSYQSPTLTQPQDAPTTAIAQSPGWEPLKNAPNLTMAGYHIGQLYTPFQERQGVADLEISAGSLESPQETRAEAKVFRIPSLRFPSTAHPTFTDQVYRLLENLWAIVMSRAAQLKFPIDDTMAFVFQDLTEDESKAVLSVTCPANISQTLAFWNSLEPDLQDWMKSLNDNEKATFINKISLRIFWR